jgi:Flp pilus assembly protein TadG
MMLGLSGVALILSMGLGIDYFVSVSAKARLDAAADAAALAAVNAAKAYYEANSSSQSLTTLIANAETAGQSVANAAFKANVATTNWTASAGFPQLTWNPSASLTFSATMSYQGIVPTLFGNLAQVSHFGVSGSATAQAQLPSYEDFYVITDTSGSMGLPTSVSDQQLLQATNPDNATWASQYPQGCQFACHYPGSQGFAYTQSHGINLKLNDVGNALQNLLTTALADETIPNQYRVGMYTYNYTMQQASALSYDLSKTSQNWNVAANLANYLDNGSQSVWYSTYFDSLWSQISPYVLPTGTGATPSSTSPFFIIVTDGVEDHADQYPRWLLPDTTSSASLCTIAKNAKITVAVILIPYTPLTNANASFSNDEDGWVNYLVDPTVYANPGNGWGQNLASGQNAQTNMQLCATSSEWFFVADTAADINTAMQTIFYQATNATRLTQ